MTSSIEMIRTILVPVSGSDADHAVLETARAAALPFAAHLSFVHVEPDLGEAVLGTPHADFARGQAIGNELDLMAQEAQSRSLAARRHIHDFCDQWRIPITDTPSAGDHLTASFSEQVGHATEQLMARARLSDIVVLGRFTHPNGLPADLSEQLLRGCGRPIMIAAPSPTTTLLRSVMVCWKSAPEPARALAAAMPYLHKAQRVLVATVDEAGTAAADRPEDVVAYLRWHGIQAEARSIAADGRPTATTLIAAATAGGADLIVMGCFSRSWARDVIFGGCTRTVLRDAGLPVLMMR
jgi:nucleotide-binding universal stress UspA family protein